MSVPRASIVLPTDGAKVMIVDFSDFQCPYCRQAFYAYKPIIAKYEAQQPGAVKFVLKDYPLDSECNVNVAGGGRVGEPAADLPAQRTFGLEFCDQPVLADEVVRYAGERGGIW